MSCIVLVEIVCHQDEYLQSKLLKLKYISKVTYCINKSLNICYTNRFLNMSFIYFIALKTLDEHNLGLISKINYIGSNTQPQKLALPSGGIWQPQKLASPSGGTRQLQKLTLPFGGTSQPRKLILPSGSDREPQKLTLPSGGTQQPQKSKTNLTIWWYLATSDTISWAESML